MLRNLEKPNEGSELRAKVARPVVDLLSYISRPLSLSFSLLPHSPGLQSISCPHEAEEARIRPTDGPTPRAALDDGAIDLRLVFVRAIMFSRSPAKFTIPKGATRVLSTQIEVVEVIEQKSDAMDLSK